MSTALAARSCVPCTGKTPPLAPARVQELLPQVPAWSLTPDGTRLTRAWRVKDVTTALAFFQRVAGVAEAEDHHPDLHLTNYRDVALELTTHAVGALTENDFILAAKIDALEQPELKSEKG